MLQVELGVLGCGMWNGGGLFGGGALVCLKIEAAANLPGSGELDYNVTTLPPILQPHTQSRYTASSVITT